MTPPSSAQSLEAKELVALAGRDVGQGGGAADRWRDFWSASGVKAIP